MRTVLLIVGVVLTVAAAPAAQQSALQQAAAALEAGTLRSLQFTASGLNHAFGQSAAPGAPWPKFNVKSYTAAVDYNAAAMRVEMLRTQGENPPRGGGGQPLAGEQRLVQFVAGGDAWNMAGQNAQPAPAAAIERRLWVWTITPQGFVKGAVANNATLKPGGGRTQVAFTVDGKHRVSGTLNAQHQVERVQTWIDNPVLGDTLIETVFSDYRAFGSVQFPGRIVQHQGGHPVLDLTVTGVEPNAAVGIVVPDNVRGATPPPVRVDVQKLGEGVYYLTGGSHHSVAIEMNDHVVVVEAPQHEERSVAVIAKIKETIPAKPVRYVVNTHHHFDHAGGLRTYAAEGTTVVTHQANRPYYEKAWSASRTINPDRLAQAKRPARFLTFTDRHVLTDGSRTIELHLIRANPHNDAIVMAYLPRERLLIEADVFTPGAADAPPPATPNPSSVNLHDNVQRLRLEVVQIAPLHGRLVTLADLLRAIGRSSSD